MLRTKELMDEIIGLLSVLRFEVESRSRLGLTDENLYCEDFAAGLLNLVHGYNLKNVNKHRKNFPGIDLGDKKEGLSYQVTATRTSGKIKHTLEMMIEHKVYKTFPKLKMFILTSKQDSYSTKFQTKDLIDFDKKADIEDMHDVLAEIKDMDVDAQEKVAKYVRKNLPDLRKRIAAGDSILPDETVPSGKMACSAAAFKEEIVEAWFEDDDVDKSMKDIDRLWKKLERLTPKSREVLYCLIERGEQGDEPESSISANAQDVNDYLMLNVGQMKAQLKVLEEKGFVDIDMDDGVTVYIGPPGLNWNVLAGISEFAGRDKAKLKAIIVDLDFEELD